ncbi:sigma-E processing peptidase SpoIIGA [Paenibacillus sp. CN-4]|uniref:sigma-E processing peptidase SpoIIGA n=1 Tax=Paenibacillus nanchangensis TaxID=3348343 RepID=UPI00397BFAA4
MAAGSSAVGQVYALTVYLDLMFAANLLIDGALLWLTGWMIRHKLRLRRLLLGALAGASYVLMMFVPELSFLYMFLVKFALSLVMLLITFGYPGLQGFTRAVGAFYVINFAAAGGILGLHYLLQSSGDIWNGLLFTSSGGIAHRLKIGFWFVLAALAVVLAGFKAVYASRIRRDRLMSYIGTVEVEIAGVTVTCQGLLDTGNRLSDPLTRTPVMVMEAELWEDHLPAAWKGRLSKDGADRLLLETDGPAFAWQDRVRLVPYRGINRASAFMLALKPDKVTVTMGEAVYRSERALIGLDGGTLSGEGAYRAVIHPDLARTGEGA